MAQRSRLRKFLLLSLPILTGLLLVGAVLAWRAQQAQRAQSIASASSAQTELAGAVGVNLSAAELADPALAETLARLEQAGLRWIRLPIPWDQVEPTRGHFDWQRLDSVFAQFRARPGLQLLVVLNGTPGWARRPSDADNPLAPPQERADFGAFAAAVARRYSAQARYYQIWHEPNIAPHWGARPIDPADYLGLLREAAVQIRAADQDAEIVLAALAPTIETGGANLSDIAFLDALYRLGAKPWFDGVAAQPYGFTAAPDAPADAQALNFGRVTLLRDVMVRQGDDATRIWATAFGWNAAAPSQAGASAPWGAVEAAAQARYATQAVELAATRWPWLGPLFWAADCPTQTAEDAWRGFALCKPDGGPNPTGNALRTAAARPPTVLPPGDHALDHPALHYAAGWRVTPRAADPAADGDVLRYDFFGTATALRVQGGPFWAYYFVTVDGLPANALPRDESGAAYLVLYDPLAAERVIPLARDLLPGQHQVRLEARGGWGQWALRGVQVTATAEAAPPLLDWHWLGLAAVLMALGWVWLLRGRLYRIAGWLAAQLDRLARWPDLFWWGAAVALGLILTFSHWLSIDFIALAGLGLLFVIRPDVALPLIACSIPFWPRPKIVVGLEFSLYEILIWIAVVALLTRWLIAPGRRQEIRALDWPVMALVGVGLFATLAAERSGVALREFRTLFLTGGLFYTLITRAPWPHGRTFSPRPVLFGLLAGMAFVSLVAVWQLFTGQGRIDVEGVGRVRAFYGSPNNLALVLDRVAPLALALAAFGSTSAFLRPRKSGGGRRSGPILYGAVALLTGVGCIATFSKGALLLGLPIGLAVILCGGAWRSGRRWPLWALAGLTLIGVLGLLALSRTPRFADLTNLSSGTGFFRIKLWQSAWRMALDHPWLGVGPDNFLYAYRTRYVLPSAWQELNLSHPHNIFLDLWTRLGLVGVLAGGWVIGAAVARGWRLFRRGDVTVWPLALGLLGGLAATLAHGLIDNSLFLVDLMALFMLTLGVLRRLEVRRNA